MGSLALKPPHTLASPSQVGGRGDSVDPFCLIFAEQFEEDPFVLSCRF